MSRSGIGDVFDSRFPMSVVITSRTSGGVRFESAKRGRVQVRIESQKVGKGRPWRRAMWPRSTPVRVAVKKDTGWSSLRLWIPVQAQAKDYLKLPPASAENKNGPQRHAPPFGFLRVMMGSLALVEMRLHPCPCITKVLIPACRTTTPLMRQNTRKEWQESFCHARNVGRDVRCSQCGEKIRIRCPLR